MIQDLAALAIVLLAVAYLLWKLRGKSRPKLRKGPDVPLRRLRRGKDG